MNVDEQKSASPRGLRSQELDRIDKGLNQPRWNDVKSLFSYCLSDHLRN